jgi:pimeloyl-ACP methyl ester carboxylesterase
MTALAPTTILVPGAWMGAWIWEPTAQRLRDRGLAAEAITLHGLEPGRAETDIAAVRLADHVQQVVDLIATADRPVVLVSHSYSGMVAASVADRLPDRVAGLVHVGSFLPTSGRSLIDDWGETDAERAQERADIDAASGLWQAPTREILEFESDLSPDNRDFLAAHFTPHPGPTVLDPAQMSAPTAQQPATYVALTPDGGFEEAWNDAPAAARNAPTWRRAHLVSGHWPMLSVPAATTDLLEAEIRHHTSTGS